MAIIANTFQSTASKTNREVLSDVVSMISPTDTPIYSMIGKESVDGTNPTWPIDQLAAPGANVQLEGDEYIFDATLAPIRPGNFTQIMRKTLIISNTQEKANDAGRQLTVAKQKAKKLLELKKDVEYSIVSNVGSTNGATRVSAGLPAWITTNVSRGAGGANGGFNTGTGLVSPATNGTQRALTRAMLDTAMGAAYSAGGNPSDMVVAPYVKTVISSFMSDTGIAAVRIDQSSNSDATLVAAVDTYRGPYGVLNVKMDRVMAVNASVARNAFLLDRDSLAYLWYRKIEEDRDIAKTGDAQKRVLIGEGCLKAGNEAANAVVPDIFGLSAST